MSKQVERLQYEEIFDSNMNFLILINIVQIHLILLKGFINYPIYIFFTVLVSFSHSFLTYYYLQIFHTNFTLDLIYKIT